MPDLWGIDDSNLYEYTAGVETNKSALPTNPNTSGNTQDGFSQNGGPFCAWYDGFLYVACRDTVDTTLINIFTWDPNTGDWTGGATETVSHAMTANLASASAGCCMIVAEGKLHCFLVTGSTTMTRATFDGTSWSETNYTGCTGVSSTFASLHQPVYFRGSVYMAIGSTSLPTSGDSDEIIGLDLDGTGVQVLDLVLTNKYWGLGLHDNRLFMVGINNSAIAPAVFHWDGASLVQATGTGLQATINGDRPAVFTQNGNLFFMTSESGSACLLYESTDRGENFTDRSVLYGAPNFASDKKLTTYVDDTELFNNNSRQVYVQAGNVSLTPGNVVYCWDGTVTGFVLRFTTSNDTGASINWYQDDIPHIRITSATDIKDGTANIVYDLYYLDATTNLEVDFLYSEDQGGTWARCKDPGSQASGSHDGTGWAPDNILRGSPTGSSRTFVWEHGTDNVAEGSTVLLKGIARIL